jgi:hypothetical protein
MPRHCVHARKPPKARRALRDRSTGIALIVRTDRSPPRSARSAATRRLTCSTLPLPRESRTRPRQVGRSPTDEGSPAPWFHSWFHVEQIWADLKAPDPPSNAGTGSGRGRRGVLITRRSRVRIPPPLLKGLLTRAFFFARFRSRRVWTPKDPRGTPAECGHLSPRKPARLPYALLLGRLRWAGYGHAGALPWGS